MSLLNRHCYNSSRDMVCVSDSTIAFVFVSDHCWLFSVKYQYFHFFIKILIYSFPHIVCRSINLNQINSQYGSLTSVDGQKNCNEMDGKIYFDSREKKIRFLYFMSNKIFYKRERCGQIFRINCDIIIKESFAQSIRIQ